MQCNQQLTLTVSLTIDPQRRLKYLLDRVKRSSMTTDASSDYDEVIVELGRLPVVLSRGHDLGGALSGEIRGHPARGRRTNRAEGKNLPPKTAEAPAVASKGSTDPGGGGTGSWSGGRGEEERDRRCHRRSKGFAERRRRWKRSGPAGDRGEICRGDQLQTSRSPLEEAEDSK